LHSIVQKRLVKKGAKCYCLFVDFSRAFDSVPHAKLLLKLMSIGVCGKMFNIIKNMFANIKACIKTADGISDVFKCPHGVRQGCMCSPLQFSVFMTALKQTINQFGGRGVQLHPDNEEVKIIMFADDIVLIADTLTGLTRHINALSDFCSNFDMSVNLNKTKVVVFRQGWTP
jgi:hypothetical protein